MTLEQHPDSPDSGQPDKNSSSQVEFNPYQSAMEIYELVVEFMKQRGELRRPSEITSEAEMEDHFDDLRRVYQQTIIFLGLDWPLPIKDSDVSLVDEE